MIKIPLLIYSMAAIVRNLHRWRHHRLLTTLKGESVCVCIYGVFAPLYSCFRTLREWYRSQNCNIGGTNATH